MKHVILISVIVVLAIAGIVATQVVQKRKNASYETIATTGIHWHPELHIFVNDKEISIPENIGLIGQHRPVHTHDDLPIIHLEFEDRVTTHDVELMRFFDSWGKDFMEFGNSVSMTVNGEPNEELSTYNMKHGDIIYLYYKTDQDLLPYNQDVYYTRMMGFGTWGMMGGVGILGIITWILIVVVLVLLIIYLFKKIK